MSLVINTNIASITTQRYLTQTQSSLLTAEQRLSSGLRVNSAKDDAAGLAIASRLTAQVNGDNVAVRNANDGVSLAQTAEGALQQISSNLQTIRQLAVQSANASNSASDRAALQSQASALIQEIDRVAKTSSFNGINLLDGSFTSKQFQVGANAGDVVNVASIASARTSTLGSSDVAAITSSQNSSSALSDGDLLINGINVGASLASADTASTASASASAIAKAAAINAKASQTGVTATVNDTEVGGNAMTATAASGSVDINGVTISIDTTGNTATSRASVVSAINAYSSRTGVTAIDTGSDANGVKLVAADGRNINIANFTTITAAETGLGSAATYTGSYTLSSKSAITLSSNSTGNIANAGLQAGSFAAQTAYVSSTQQAAGAGTGIVAGDFSINGVLIGSSLASSDTASYNQAAHSAIAKAAAINSISAKTGVSAKANPNLATGSAMTAAAQSGILYINGVATGTISTTTNAADSRKAVTDAINAISGQTGVVAINTNSNTAGVQLVAADGRNITVTQNSAGTLTAATSGLNSAFITAQAGATATQAEKNAGTIEGTVTLSSTNQFTIDGGTTNTGDLTTTLTASLGIDLGVYGAGKSGQSLNSVDLSTVDGANKALTAIDNAINSISTSSADLGAIENRFNSVVANLQTTAENQSSALSRIQDADFAAETANYTKANVLQQAATSILSQANSSPQQVLTLLQRL